MRLRPPPIFLIRTYSQTKTAPKARGSRGFGVLVNWWRR